MNHNHTHQPAPDLFGASYFKEQGMTTPYYQDELVTLYHGDSLEILPTLDIKAEVLLTDPPYFKVKKDAWDNQWGGASEFLAWMGEWLDLAKTQLDPNGAAYVFASPAMTTAVERVMGERFRVLNSIRWIKEAGWHRKVEVASLRSYLSPWEGIIFAEIKADAANESETLRGVIFKPLGEYFLKQCAMAGRDIRHIAVDLGYNTALGLLWGRGVRFPTEDAYGRMRQLLGREILYKDYAELRSIREKLSTQHELVRRPFLIPDRMMASDVWHFPTVKPYKGKHPCEKPAEMLRHMIDVSSKPGGLILDPFAGSGSTLETARQAGRRAVGIEQDERWCEHAANRLSQETVELEWTA